jgi:septal ring factor EnvC (AmiA/AmiB activator)
MRDDTAEVKSAIELFDKISGALKTYLAAEASNARLPETQKAMEQAAAELASIEKKKAKATAELAAQETELEDLSAKVDAFRAEHGLAMRYSELLEKVKEQEGLLRVANSKFAAMVKKVESISEVRR